MMPTGRLLPRTWIGALLGLLAIAGACDRMIVSVDRNEKEGDGVSAGADVSPNTAARSLLEDLAADDVAAAAERFHYPPGYAAGERSADVASVREGLEILSRHFGPVRELSEVSEIGAIAHVGIGGGTGPYWQRCGAATLVAFRVEFENVRQGAALVRFCRMEGAWRLQALHLGGSPSDREVRAVLGSVRRDMAVLTP